MSNTTDTIKKTAQLTDLLTTKKIRVVKTDSDKKYLGCYVPTAALPIYAELFDVPITCALTDLNTAIIIYAVTCKNAGLTVDAKGSVFVNGILVYDNAAQDTK